MTDPSFEKNNNTTDDISATGVIGGSDWNVTSLSYARVALFNSSSTISTFGGTTSVSNGSYYLMIRSNLDQGKTQNIRQNSDMALPKGRYSISFDYKAARVKNVNRKFTISAVNSAGSSTFGSKAIDIQQQTANTSYFNGIDWSTASFEFTHESTTNTRINISCETQGTANSSSSQHTVVLLDNFVINYSNINGSTLANLIAQATNINSKLGTLTSEIAAAQSVYDGINNTPAYQETIDNAITTLQSAINTKVAAYSYNPAGDDVSCLLLPNPGFDIDINFESSSSTAISAATVYPTFGWTPTVPGNSTGATMGYGFSGSINSDNATAPTQNADGTTAGGALIICVGWSGQVTYKSDAKTLPAGSYRITYRAYNGNTKNTEAVEAKPLVGFVPTSGEPQINDVTESFANQAWSTHTYDFSLASDTEGQIQIGLQPTSNTNSYNAPELFIDEVKLEYFNPLTLAQIQWQEVHDALALLDATALPDAAETAITDALSAAEPTTVDGYNTAKAALQALIDNYDGIKAAYDKAKDLITFVTSEVTNSTGTKTTIEAAISYAITSKESCTDVSGLNSVYDALETARQTYVTSGAEPADGHPFDITFKINNPGFEANGTASDALVPTGWTIPTQGQKYGTKAKGTISNAKGSYVFNNWVSWWNSLNVQQTVSELPKGRYEVTAVIAGYNGVASKLEAGGGTTWMNMTGENNGIRVSVNGNVTGTSLAIKAETVGKDGGSLLIADDFTLSFIGLKPVLNDLITSATALTTANVGDGAFQIPSSAASTLSDAIDDAQAVYDDADAYGDDIQNAIDALNAAITTFQVTELNAPASGVRYKLALDGRGTLTFQTASTDGGYGMPFTDAADYKAQAFALTKVSGNNYNMSFTDLDGNTRYICTRAAYGEGGTGTAGIRTTTESEKALAITIKATTTDGVYNLLNTARENAKLGSNGGDFYTDNAYTLWSFVEASQVSVPVTISSEVKLATRIFPFKPSLPSGMKAYSCGDSEGDVLTLVEVAEPAANTPYILYAPEGYTGAALTGYGTATTDTYTTGWLTGVYTSTDAPVGSYVLQNNGGVSFYKVAEYKQPSVGAYRCYLTALTTARALYFSFDDETTGINTIKALMSGETTIYNAAGAVVPSLQKGLNIIKMSDGSIRKVMVK